ncbi:MAG: hypothetical protein KIT22_08645, partial [Verrucomicrobiae bacterium]|nr:hypothetical protein [Verrucomicrobiae bacterium]
MNHSTSHDESRVCRLFFIGVEVALALAWCGFFFEQRFSMLPGALSDVCSWTFGISIILLLFVLPWFWAALRHVALIGWLMGAVSVLYVLLHVHPH